MRRRSSAAFGALVMVMVIVVSDRVQGAPPTKPLVGDACKVLSDGEVRKVFPDAKGAVANHSTDEYGISSCEWSISGGRFAAQILKRSGTVQEELQSRADGLIDPFNPAAKRGVRYETLKNVGDGAMAVVEREDAKRGILSSAAIVVVQRGEKELILMSTELAGRDRAAALKALEDLGRAAAKRM